MKIIRYKFILPLLIVFAFSSISYTQDSLPFDLSCDIYPNYPPLSMSKETLEKADSIAHLDRMYKSSWIREFISVEISASHNGSIKRAMSKNDLLTREQKDLMIMADFGSSITVKVDYIPDNNLKHNDPKNHSFSFLVDPENEAAYPGGKTKRKEYLKENILDKIPLNAFKQHQLYAVKFIIDEDGIVSNPHVFWSSEDESTDRILLESICNMPIWKPAEYANGNKVKQEFVLLVGDMKSCTLNMVNTRKNYFGE